MHINGRTCFKSNNTVFSVVCVISNKLSSQRHAILSLPVNQIFNTVFQQSESETVRTVASRISQTHTHTRTLPELVLYAVALQLSLQPHQLVSFLLFHTQSTGCNKCVCVGPGAYLGLSVGGFLVGLSVCVYALKNSSWGYGTHKKQSND